MWRNYCACGTIHGKQLWKNPIISRVIHFDVLKRRNNGELSSCSSLNVADEDLEVVLCLVPMTVLLLK